MKLWIKTVICVVAIEVAGLLSGLLTTGSIGTWFAELEKPPGNPPNWVFGPVWTTLYALMGIAVARVWHAPPHPPVRRTALLFFTVQMILNLAWTPVFFGAHQIGVALLIIVALLFAIGLTIHLFRQVDKPAAWLLVPYLLWVGYATYLNTAFLILNPTPLATP